MAHRILTSLVGIDATFSSTLSLTSLAGVGNRMLIVDSAGTVSTQAIPTGTVTSVGLSMPSAFTVTNSPVTGAGTLTVTGAGTTAQYIRGDGTLANFPTSTGGGSSFNYYLNGSISQGTFGGDTYYQMSKTPILGAGTDFTRTNGQGDGYIASFITNAGDPSLLNIPGGNWNLEFYFQSSASGGGPQFYGEIYKVSAANVFTLVASGSVNPEGITNGTTVDQYFTSIPVPQTSLLITDRIAIRIYVITSGRTITLHTENGNLCEVLTTFSTGLTALNGLTAQVQYLAVGTSGTDFNISSVTDTHTFNLPTASATNRGALSSTDWSTFNGKQDAITLTTTGTSGAATLVGSTLNIPQYQSVITNPVTGTGTTNYLSKFTGSTTLGNSLVYDDGTFVGIGTSSPSAKLQTAGSLTASGAIARGVYFNNTLVAAANNDVLVGLDIAPTFTNGAFTNVSNLAIRTNGNVQVRGNTTQFGQVLQVLNTAGSSIFYVRDVGDALLNGTLWLSAQNGSNFISGGQLGITSNSGTVGNQFIRFTHNNGNNAFRVLSNSNIELNPVAGNVLIGTTTDAGFKLDVNGTTRSQGKLTITTGGAEITGNVVAYTGIQSYGQVQIFSAAAFQMFNAANNSKASFQYINANGLLLTTNSDNISGVLKGLQVNPTTVASANNDTLVGLDISPTFTAGAFTGVTTLGLRVQSGVSSFGGNVIMNGNNFYLGGNFGNTVIRTISTTNVQIFNNNAGATLFLNANGSVQIGQSSATSWALFSASGHTIYNTTNTYFFSTGNIGINQSSDAGYKLDVNGTGRFSSNFYVSGGTNTNVGNGIHAYYESNYAQVQLNGATGSLIDFSTSGTDYLARILYTNSTNLLEFKNNVGTTNFSLANSGTATFANLGGSGTRMVVADATGILSTQAVPTGTITGSGTTNYIPKFTGSTAIGNSNIYDNGGNIGIGTTGATYRLEVNGVTSTNGLYISGLYTFGQSSSGIEMQLLPTSYNAIRWYQGTDWTGVIHSFGRSWSGGMSVGMINIQGFNGVSIGSWANQIAMFLESSGNVLIGTTTDNGSKFQVNGTSYFSTDMYVEQNHGIFFSGNGNYNTGLYSSGDNIVFQTQYIERMRVAYNGNVGIGTTSPTTKLCITDSATMYAYKEGVLLDIKRNASNGNDTTSRAGLRLGNNSNAFDILYGGTSDRLRFIDGGSTEVVSMLNGGNVGVGVTAPTAKLQVVGNNGVFSAVSQTADAYLPTKTITEFVGLFNSGSNGHHLYVNSTSNLGTLEFNLTKTWGGILTFGVSNDGTAITRVLSIASSGNVTVGTTTDAGFKFDVIGTSRVTDTLTVGAVGTNGTINLARGSNGGVTGAIIQTSGITQILNYQGSGIDFYVNGASNVTRAFVRTTGIGITGTSGGNFTMDASAALQINSTIQGFLPPRMTVAQRTSISTPATGLVVYQTDSVEGLYVNTSSGWKALTMV